MKTHKFVGSAGWHVLLGLAFGWVGTAGASEAWRNRLFVVGLVLVFAMGAIEMVSYIKRKHQAA